MAFLGRRAKLIQIDEVDIFARVWHYAERPQRFTPTEFQELWNSFSYQRKIQYVTALLKEH